MKFLTSLLMIAGAATAQTGFRGGPALDNILQDAVRKNEIPGAVVLVGHEGRVVYRKAYGSRALVPKREAMTLDTVFDVASLTKVVATASSVMKLVEQGKLRISDLVTRHIPEFQGGKSDITLRHLLTHCSGLRPDVDLEPAWTGYETGIAKAVVDLPTAPPGTKFVYSDINFILLGEIVRRVGGVPLPDFARNEIFTPLGMADTSYLPNLSIRSRIAPTEQVKGMNEPLRGVVHDPTTRFMEGVAGHAGLFSTASDLSKFAEMILGGGERDGIRIFSPMTVRLFTSPQSPPELSDVRGLGWDINSRFSGNRGDLFPLGSFGHTGFTGTSIWIDPSSNSYVILLTNSGHPHLRPVITGLRGRVANAAAAGLALQQSIRQAVVQPRNGSVSTGADVLAAEKFALLAGKRVGLITNHTGLLKDGRRTIDAMVGAGVKLTALFSPEHGLAGKEDHENISNSTDVKTGIPIHSLYSGPNRKPNIETLRNLDVLVFDIQDVGARFYTYMCTMKNAMEEAATLKLHFVVLDRPNPITGEHVEGPVLEPALKSFIGCSALPVRHGMTVGELAGFMNDELPVKANLQVVRMTGWSRGDWFDSTGMVWVNPSPNMRSLNAALLYPGIGMLEGGTAYSVGRGTDSPFEQVGAAWMNGQQLASYLNSRNAPGIRVYPTQLSPVTSNFSGKSIEGIRFVLTNRDVFDSVGFGIELGCAIGKLFPGKMQWNSNNKLAGSIKLLNGMEAGETPESLKRAHAAELMAFRQRRGKYLLY